MSTAYRALQDRFAYCVLTFVVREKEQAFCYVLVQKEMRWRMQEQERKND